MNLRHFRVGARVLVRDPLFSILSILGLSIALAMALLLFGYARYSFKYNAHVPDAERVYVVKIRKNLDLGRPWQDLSPVALSMAALQLPGVNGATAYTTWLPITMKVNGEARKVHSLIALPGFARMLGLEAVQGDVERAMSSPDEFAITGSAARRLFGTADVLGRAVDLASVENMKSMARVGAVLRDPPANTTIPFEVLHGRELSLVPGFMKDELTTGAQLWPGHVLVRMAPGGSVADVAAAFQKMGDESTYARNLPPEMKEKLGGLKPFDVALAPLRDAYFDDQVQFTSFSLPVERGNRALVLGLVAVAVLLLAIAAFNYVNLATIRVIRRQREIGLRKVLGAGRRALLQQFVAESLIVSLAATALGLSIAWAALPAFGAMMNRDLGGVVTPLNCAAALGLGLLVGLLTALYPASIALGVRPARLLAGRGDSQSLPARRLRQALSMMQLAAAMALAAIGLAVFWQTRFAMNVSPGFDPEPLLVFEINDGIIVGANEQSRGFMAALSSQPGIANVTYASDSVGSSKNRWSPQLRHEGTAANVDVKGVSPSFFETHEIRPVAGRLFTRADRASDREPMVLNELAVRRLGFASPAAAVGQPVVMVGADNKPVTKRIVGVAPEVRFYSLREPPAPIAYELWDDGASVTVRASGSLAAAERAVRGLWPRYYPNAVLDIRPARSVYAANYADDARLGRLLALATSIALVIAFFGAYVIAADTVQRRTREIALRKLFGARRGHIARLVAREMGTILIGAAVVAVPVAALSIARYLAPYSERTPLAYWMLLAAFAGTALVVAIAATRETRAAVRTRPAQALR
jgi:putative ABC transport system permease protein